MALLESMCQKELESRKIQIQKNNGCFGQFFEGIQATDVVRS